MPSTAPPTATAKPPPASRGDDGAGSVPKKRRRKGEVRERRARESGPHSGRDHARPVQRWSHRTHRERRGRGPGLEGGPPARPRVAGPDPPRPRLERQGCRGPCTGGRRRGAAGIPSATPPRGATRSGTSAGPTKVTGAPTAVRTIDRGTRERLGLPRDGTIAVEPRPRRRRPRTSAPALEPQQAARHSSCATPSSSTGRHSNAAGHDSPPEQSTPHHSSAQQTLPGPHSASVVQALQ